jgi:acyl carrier protein
LQQGLQAAAETLSGVYAESRKTYPELKGHLRGSFHIEPNGTPRLFMESGSSFTPVEGKGISDDFVGVTFGGKWKFPAVGKDLMLTVDYELEPGGSGTNAATTGVVDKVRSEVAKILKKEPSQIDVTKPLVALGADELDLVEIVMAVEEAFKIEIPDSVIGEKPNDVSKTLTVLKLAEIVSNRSKTN